MMYSYTLVEERFGETGAALYLYNPMAVAVLLMQRGFWVGTTDDPAVTVATQLPDHLFTRGLVMTAVSLVLLVLAQRVFAKLEAKVPERLG
jgi:ABC-2 type transport system permease protein